MNQIRHGTNSTCIRCTIDRRLIIKSNGQSGFEFIQRELEPDFNLLEDYPIEKLNIILRFDEKTEKIQEVTFNKDQMDIKTTFGIGQFWTKNYQDRFRSLFLRYAALFLVPIVFYWTRNPTPA